MESIGPLFKHALVTHGDLRTDAGYVAGHEWISSTRIQRRLCPGPTPEPPYFRSQRGPAPLFSRTIA